MDFSSHNPKTSNALSLAARANDVNNLRRLLKKINPNCVDNRGWTCLHEAAFHDSFESLQMILDRRNCRPYVESHEGHTALYVACLNTSSVRCIEYLLQNVKDIANYASKEMFTPLHLVSRQGRTDVLQLLLDHGAIVNVVDFDGDTALHEACLAKQPQIVNILLHAGADAELPNDNQATPLHIACSRGCLDTVKYLYPFITDVNTQDTKGDTPLMAACYGENEDVIQFLLDHGADPNIDNNDSKMAIDLALERGLVRGFKLIFEATEKDEISPYIVYVCLSPSYLNIDIVDAIFASDLDPIYYFLSKPLILDDDEFLWQSLRSYVGKNESSSYSTSAPLCTFLDVAEYIYKLSVDKFDELFYLIMTKGLSTNAGYGDEMPPLVGLLYCPHTDCFDHILDLLVQFDCNVDYSSEKIQRFPTDISSEQLDKDKINLFPDAFYLSLLFNPAAIPAMIPYSLRCDPGFILKSAYKHGVLAHFQTSTISKLIKMIDSNCEIEDYEGFKHYVPSLKHLSRLQVRQQLQKIGFLKTRQYLELLDKLPLPKRIRQYLRFL